MKGNVLISIINLSLIILFLVYIPNMDKWEITAKGLAMLILPWLVFFGLKWMKFKDYKRGLWILNSLVLTTFLLVFSASYSMHIGKMNLHFDKYNTHEHQKEAEKSVQEYIRKNAKFPKSYESVQFGNLNSTKVLSLDSNEVKTLKKQINSNDFSDLDRLTKSKIQSSNFGGYFIRHSYFLNNYDDIRFSRIAYVELDENFEVTSIYNEEDFGRISWNEAFGKK